MNQIRKLELFSFPSLEQQLGLLSTTPMQCCHRLLCKNH